jgi:hypothetical protein
MKKYLLPLLVVAVGCSDDSESARIKELEQQNQQLQSYYQQNQSVQPPPQIIQQPSQPVVVQEHNDNGLLGGIAGFMAGHALGSMGNNNGSSNSTHIVERHYETNRIRDMPNSSPSSSRLPKVIQPPVNNYSSNYNNSSSTRSVAPTTTIRPRISSGPSRSLSSSIRRR